MIDSLERNKEDFSIGGSRALIIRDSISSQGGQEGSFGFSQSMGQPNWRDKGKQKLLEGKPDEMDLVQRRNRGIVISEMPEPRKRNRQEEELPASKRTRMEARAQLEKWVVKTSPGMWNFNCPSNMVISQEMWNIAYQPGEKPGESSMIKTWETRIKGKPRGSKRLIQVKREARIKIQMEEERLIEEITSLPKNDDTQACRFAHPCLQLEDDNMECSQDYLNKGLEADPNQPQPPQ